jgi:nitrogen-specific signal transduction histidine kinase
MSVCSRPTVVSGVRYSSVGSCRIDAQLAATVRFHNSGTRGDATAVIEVKDSGSGLLPEAVPTLLGRMYATSKGGGGTSESVAETAGKYGSVASFIPSLLLVSR